MDISFIFVFSIREIRLPQIMWKNGFLIITWWYGTWGGGCKHDTCGWRFLTSLQSFCRKWGVRSGETLSLFAQTILAAFDRMNWWITLSVSATCLPWFLVSLLLFNFIYSNPVSFTYSRGYLECKFGVTLAKDDFSSHNEYKFNKKKIYNLDTNQSI